MRITSGISKARYSSPYPSSLHSRPADRFTTSSFLLAYCSASAKNTPYSFFPLPIFAGICVFRPVCAILAVYIGADKSFVYVFVPVPFACPAASLHSLFPQSSLTHRDAERLYPAPANLRDISKMLHHILLIFPSSMVYFSYFCNAPLIHSAAISCVIVFSCTKL